jgi:hypothetical protein
MPDPKTDLNGVEAIADAMARNPKKRWVAIVVFDTAETTINHDSGVKTPKGRILEVEVIQDPDESERLHDRLVRVRDERQAPKQPKDHPGRLFEGNGVVLRTP